MDEDRRKQLLCEDDYRCIHWPSGRTCVNLWRDENAEGLKAGFLPGCIDVFKEEDEDYEIIIDWSIHNPRPRPTCNANGSYNLAQTMRNDYAGVKELIERSIW